MYNDVFRKKENKYSEFIFPVLRGRRYIYIAHWDKCLKILGNKDIFPAGDVNAKSLL